MSELEPRLAELLGLRPKEDFMGPYFIPDELATASARRIYSFLRAFIRVLPEYDPGKRSYTTTGGLPTCISGFDSDVMRNYVGVNLEFSASVVSVESLKDFNLESTFFPSGEFTWLMSTALLGLSIKPEELSGETVVECLQKSLAHYGAYDQDTRFHAALSKGPDSWRCLITSIPKGELKNAKGTAIQVRISYKNR